jgi:hypothetical protein
MPTLEEELAKLDDEELNALDVDLSDLDIDESDEGDDVPNASRLDDLDV